MSEAPHPALLPTGMHDLLPPEAEIEATVGARLMATLAAHGYERVKPPLVEFEETLFAGAGAAMAGATFRMMDPVSHRMIGVRADVTPQIARIAATRLGEALATLGVPNLSVDITLPTLVPSIAEAYGIDGARAAALRAALDHKDAAAVAAAAGEAGALLERLLAAAGPAGTALAALDRLDLPERACAE